MDSEIQQIKDRLHGQWISFISYATGYNLTGIRNKPCPICGEGTDRFSYDNRGGQGNYFCRQGDKHPDRNQAGDGLAFVINANRISIAQALKLARNYLNMPEPERQKTKAKVREVEPTAKMQIQEIGGSCVIPAPELQYKPGETITVLDKNSKSRQYSYAFMWEWLDPKGIRVGYIGRQASKTTHQLFKTEEIEGWQQGSFPIKPEPAFCPKSDSDIWIWVEGEKAAMAVAGATKKYSVCTNVCGINRVLHPDWSFLEGKIVYLCPDNDPEGFEGVSKLQKLLKGKATTIIINPPEGSVEKWDLANLVEELQGNPFDESFDERFETMIKEPAVQEDEEPEDKKKEDRNARIKQLIRPLGFTDNTCHLMHWHEDEYKKVYVQEVAEAKQGTITKQALQFWKDWKDWKDVYGEKPDMDEIIPDIVRACKDKGVYNRDKIRGAGFWIDKGRLIFHSGTRLYVNGNVANLADMDSNYIYQSRPSIVSPDFDFARRLTEEEKEQVIKVFLTANVSKLSYCWQMIGWAVLAPLSGALKWRPHMYLEGKTASGKSSVFRTLRTLFGPGVEDITDSPTEASIRQRLKSDARPVIFDESEAKGKFQSNERIKIDGLKRASCSESDAKIIRGTASGEAQVFIPKFMIAEAGINKPKSEEANLNRELEIELLHNLINVDRSNPPRCMAKYFENPLTFSEAFGNGTTGGILSEWDDNHISDAWISHCASLLPIIKKNFIIFKKIIEAQADGRTGDTFGWVLAAFTAFVFGEITMEDKYIIETALDAAIWDKVSTRKTEEVTELELLKYINQLVVQIESSRGYRTTSTVFGAIQEEKALWGIATLEATDRRKDIAKTLGLYGIALKRDAEGDQEFHVCIGNKNQMLARLMDKTNYDHRWNSILKRLEGTAENIPFHCPGQQSQRGLKIPYNPYFLCEQENTNENLNPDLSF